MFGKVSLLIILLLLMMGGMARATNRAVIDPETDGYFNKLDEDRQLIVLVAPGAHDPYYQSDYEEILDFQVRFASAVVGRDNLLILVDREAYSRLRHRVPEELLLPADLADIWIRDFAPVVAEKTVRFAYQPEYLKPSDASYIRDSFDRFVQLYGLEFKHSDLVLDGGNMVENGRGKAVVTTRFLTDNPGLSSEDARAALKQLLGLTGLAIIPEEEGDITGHADGMVMWVSPETLFINQYDEPFRSRVRAALKSGLPGIELVEVAAEFSPETRDGFGSACGLNVNSVTTERFIYVPVFGHPTDEVFLKTVKNHTEKQVVTVNAEAVCSFGGNLRCLSWQLAGEEARQLIKAARAGEAIVD